MTTAASFTLECCVINLLLRLKHKSTHRLAATYVVIIVYIKELLCTCQNTEFTFTRLIKVRLFW
jgi:hypothetical protein